LESWAVNADRSDALKCEEFRYIYFRDCGIYARSFDRQFADRPEVTSTTGPHGLFTYD
jgi:hypothetical protein